MSQRDGEEWVRLIDSKFTCEGCGGKCGNTAQWEEGIIRCDKSCCGSNVYCNECTVKEGCFSAEVEIDNENLEKTTTDGDIMTPIQQREALLLLKRAWITTNYLDRNGNLSRKIEAIIDEIENDPKTEE